jgi:hypothetical protein
MFSVGSMVPFMVQGVSIPVIFGIFGIITTSHGIFNIIFIRETANLTDKEKKTLYVPKSLKSK